MGRDDEKGGNERDGSQRAEPTTPDNVVRFPREWIGPIGELVPFGPNARGTDRGTSGPSSSADPPGGTGAALGADAFWGGDSASLHEVMQPPVAQATPSQASGCRVAPDARADANTGGGAGAGAPGEGDGVPDLLGGALSRRRRYGRARGRAIRLREQRGVGAPTRTGGRHRERATIGAVVGCCLAAIALAVGWGGGSGAPVRARVSADRRATGSVASTPPTIGTRRAESRVRPQNEVAPHRSSHARASADDRRRLHSGAHRATARSTGVAVDLGSTGTTDGSEAADSTVDSPTTDGTTSSSSSSASSVSTTPQATDASSGATKQTAAGPEGAGAPFGPGTIG